MIFTVDRMEGNVVVLEDENGDIVTVSVEKLPACKAGDVLRLEENGVYTVDADEAAHRRNVAFSLEQKLKQKFRK